MLPDNDSKANPSYPAIGERIALLLQDHQLSMTELAEAVGVSKFTVSQWCKGRNLTMDAVVLLATELGISLNWLVLGVGERQQASDIQLEPQEEELVTICRHISNGITPAAAHFFRSLTSYNANNRRIETYTGAENLFNDTHTARLVALTDGRIMESNVFFRQMLGLPPIRPLPTSLFELVPREQHRRLKTEISTVLSMGVSQYNTYTFLLPEPQPAVNVISKSALIHYDGQLAMEMILQRI